MTADLDHDLEARLARAGAHLDALAARDGAAGSPGSDAGGPGEVAYVRRSAGSPPPGRRLALAAAVVLLVAAVAGGLYLARPDGGPSGVATDPTPAPTTTAPPTTSRSDFTLRPVLVTAVKSGPCPGRQLPAADGGSCYSLGPAGITAADVDTADAVRTSEDRWEVRVLLRPDRQAAGNSLLNSCFDGDSTCPSYRSDGPGAVAAVWRGVVVSAPAVNVPNLATGTLVIAGVSATSAEGGGFTEADAKALAAELHP